MYLKPLITEKTAREAGISRYTFVVDPKMRKEEIRKIIGRTFGVTVKGVETIKVPGKLRRYGKRARVVRSSSGKKAIVTLIKGQKIDLFEAPAQESSPVSA